ncbi:MAG: CPBP family intramembrane metalloprotease [Bacteroidetes bacterium]|nr:CPBP family intramembrane metalloprotease [Bacteroidota bacterium]
MLLLVVTHFIIPFFSAVTGVETIIFWLLCAALLVFLPLVITAIIMLKSENQSMELTSLIKRLRFHKPDKGDILWSIGGIIAIGLISSLLMYGQEIFLGAIETQPAFMSFEPLTPGRYWILALWLPYWILNIMGEEILWRGVILPRQEISFGKKAWIVNGIGWGIFHIAFGWHLMITLIPILLIQPYIAQKRKNNWTSVIIHATINGPSFIAISFGLL